MLGGFSATLSVIKPIPERMRALSNLFSEINLHITYSEVLQINQYTKITP